MRRPLALAALVTSIVAVSAAPAGANYTASFNSTSGELSASGDGASDTLRIFRDAAGAIHFDLGDDGTADDLNGSAPNNFTVANVTNFRITADGGDDRVTLDQALGALPRAVMVGGSGKDDLTGGAAGDTFLGGEGDDVMRGAGGSDILSGGDGADDLTGGDADDIVHGDGGNDTSTWNPGDDSDDVEGGADRDRQIISGGGGAEDFDISPNGGHVALARLNPAPFTINTSGVESATVRGNGGTDTITGHSGLRGLIELELDGGTGNDTVNGGDGDDRIAVSGSDLTGPTDAADGFDGNDTLAVAGSDVPETYSVGVAGGQVEVTNDLGHRSAVTRVERVAIATAGGNDVVQAADSLAAVAALDLELGAGNDIAGGGGAGDRLAGGEGDDTLLGRGGDDALFGDAGTDTLNGGDGADSLNCGGFGDQLFTDSSDTIAADCREPAAPPGGEQPGPSGQPQGPPALEPGLPAGFRGFARPRVKGSLTALSVTLVNTHSAPITVRAAATESRNRYRTVTKTIAPGANIVVKLRTPSKLRKALARKLRRSRKVSRRPRITVTNAATGGKSTVAARLTLRRR